MADWTTYLTTAGIVMIPVACLILAGLLSSHLNPPETQKQIRAHAEALRYLGDIILHTAVDGPDPVVIQRRVRQVLEILEYPGRGDVSDWECTLCAALYPGEEEPQGPWDSILAAFFEFARVNLHCGFDSQHDLTSYERVRACLAVVGVEAKSADELRLGRV